MFSRRDLIAVSACLLVAACETRQPPASSPAPGNGETITGRERLGWDQRAADTSELATFRYAVYVDGTRSELADAACATAAGANGFPCSGRLPAMSPGAHTLELAAFVIESGSVIESAKSPPLRVTVTGSTAPAPANPLSSGDQVTTADGVRLDAQLLAEGIEQPSDLGVSADGLLFVASRDGRIWIHDTSGDFREALTIAEARPPGALHALTLAPDFPETRLVFVTYTTLATERVVFRTARYREFNRHLVDRMIVLPDVPAAPEPAAALRFGPDGRLYAAFDHGGDADAAARLSEWSGKILRLEPDGRTPADQPAASPVFWTGISAPRGLAWTEEGSLLWMVDEGTDGVERIRAIAPSTRPKPAEGSFRLGAPGERPQRAEQRASYVLPRPLGGAGLAAHAGRGLPQFAGNLFVAARAGGYLLRIRLDPSDPARAVSSERLLENRLGPVHAVAVGPNGDIYVGAGSEVWRLTAK